MMRGKKCKRLALMESIGEVELDDDGGSDLPVNHKVRQGVSSATGQVKWIS